MKRLAGALCGLVLGVFAGTPACPALAETGAAAATFARFVAAQNAHDLKAVEAFLADTPDLLWITRGKAVWGTGAALNSFATSYEGTWMLRPDMSGLKEMPLGPSVTQLFVPVVFSVGPAGQDPQETRFLVNVILVKTAEGWRIRTLLPVPVAP